MLTAIPVITLFTLLAFGVPVSFSLGISGSLGLLLVNGFNFTSLLSILGTTAHSTVASFVLTTIPMFILMAEFASSGKLAGKIFVVINRWLGHLPGGTAISTCLASAGFGAICGSSSAGAATMANISVPEMIKLNFSPRVATGVVAMAGTLAILIPPSIPMVVFGIVTESSIGRLLIAGVVPGLLTAVMYSLGIVIWTKLRPEDMPRGRHFTWGEKFEVLKDVLPFMIIVFLVIGGMYLGIATPTEVAAIGALATLVMCLLLGTIDRQGIIKAVERTILTSSMIFTIMIGAMLFGYFLTSAQVAQSIIAFIAAAGIPGWAVLASVILVYLVLGCFLDTISILLITLPLTYPLITGLGFDGLWFGVIVVKVVEIGLVTPPVGMNVYVTSGVTGVPLEEVFKGVGVLLIFELLTLVLLLAFPAISLYLPSLMM